MAVFTAKALREQRKALETKVSALIDKSEAEERVMTAEEDAAFRVMMKDSLDLKSRYEIMEAREAREVEMTAFSTEEHRGGVGSAVLDSDSGHQHEARAAMQNKAIQGWFYAHSPGYEHLATEEHHAAARAVKLSINSSELAFNLSRDIRNTRRRYAMRNSLNTQVGATGGSLVGESFMTNFELARLQYGGILQVADILSTDTGEPITWPTVDDTGNTGAQVGEESETEEGNNPDTGGVKFYAHKFTSKALKISYELLRDAPETFVGKIGEILGERVGRIINTRCTVGSGANTCEGIVNGSYLGVTAALSNGIAFDEVIDLEHSVDPAYRDDPSVGYMCHDTTVLVVRKLKNGQGAYLWQQSANAGTPDTLNNRPFHVNQDMPQIGSGNRSMVFGPMKSYKVREVRKVRFYRLGELYRLNDQDGFVAFQEVDGKVVDAGTHPLRYLLHP